MFWGIHEVRHNVWVFYYFALLFGGWLAGQDLTTPIISDMFSIFQSTTTKLIILYVSKTYWLTVQQWMIQRGMYQRKVDVDMLNAVKSVLADVSSVSPSSEQRGDCGLGMSLYR